MIIAMQDNNVFVLERTIRRFGFKVPGKVISDF